MQEATEREGGNQGVVKKKVKEILAEYLPAEQRMDQKSHQKTP